MLTPTRTLWIALAFGFGCAPGDDPRPAAQRATTRSGATDDAGATDDDGGEAPDSFCAEGEDCGVTNPALVDERSRCVVALTECPCAADAPPVACDVDTDGPVTPQTCFTGQRTCAEGRWGRCLAYRNRFQ
jgi:hypothetical protein